MIQFSELKLTNLSNGRTYPIQRILD